MMRPAVALLCPPSLTHISCSSRIAASSAADLKTLKAFLCWRSVSEVILKPFRSRSAPAGDQEALGMEGSAAGRLGPSITTGGNLDMGCEISIYQSHLRQSAAFGYENAKPRANPTTRAAKRSGSATMRKLLRIVSSMMRLLLEERRGWEHLGVASCVECGSPGPRRTKLVQRCPGSAPTR